MPAGVSNYTGSGNVFLGNEAGYNETGSNKFYLANSEVNPPLIYSNFYNIIDVGRTELCFLRFKWEILY